MGAENKDIEKLFPGMEFLTSESVIEDKGV